MMAVEDSEAGSDCGLTEQVREAVMSSVEGEVIVEEEGWNSVIVAVGSNVSPTVRSPLLQLITLTGQVAAKVRSTHTGWSQKVAPSPTKLSHNSC